MNAPRFTAAQVFLAAGVAQILGACGWRGDWIGNAGTGLFLMALGVF